jgi:DNA-binding NtrC family response regulator
VQIEIPPLRKRIADIESLSVHFLNKFAEKYNKPATTLTPGAIEKLTRHNWPGNIRELQHEIEKALILADSQTITEKDILTNTNSAKTKEYSTFNLVDNEKELIKSALETFDGNMSLTAQKLGINRSTLYEKIKKYGL